MVRVCRDHLEPYKLCRNPHQSHGQCPRLRQTCACIFCFTHILVIYQKLCYFVIFPHKGVVTPRAAQRRSSTRSPTTENLASLAARANHTQCHSSVYEQLAAYIIRIMADLLLDFGSTSRGNTGLRQYQVHCAESEYD